MKPWKAIKLTKNKWAMVDSEDYDILSKRKWRTLDRKRTCYAQRTTSVKNKRSEILMHRFIIDARKGQQVDHINGNGLDNRKKNLRLCTPSQNQHNRHSIYGRSKYCGVSKVKGCISWQARICTNKKTTNLGSFKTEIEAAKAYDKAVLKYRGEFIYLNFPEDYPNER